MFCQSGKVLEWLQSYLEQLNNLFIDLYLVYQKASIINPLFFILYIGPLEIIAQRYGIKSNLCADDTQPYIYH